MREAAPEAAPEAALEVRAKIKIRRSRRVRESRGVVQLDRGIFVFSSSAPVAIAPTCHNLL